MNSSQFTHDNEPRWQRLEQMLKDVEKGRPPADVDELPTLFRQVCHDLSLAQHRMYDTTLVHRLNELAIAGYRTLERRISGGWERLLRMTMLEFPRAVRAEWRLFWFCCALFWGPFLFFAIWTPFDPEWAMRLLGPEQMVMVEAMYGHHTSPEEFKREHFGSDFAMFAFYIWNNVGIDLKCFASGLLGGVGTLLVVLYNGVIIGAMTGYVHHACNVETFYSFVAGHSAPELMGVVVSGMAGMRLGLSLIKPGCHDRKTALILGGRKAFVLIAGACLMTSFAAVIEGFWSATPMAPMIKYCFGGAMWVVTLCYLGFSGRSVDALVREQDNHTGEGTRAPALMPHAS